MESDDKGYNEYTYPLLSVFFLFSEDNKPSKYVSREKIYRKKFNSIF